MERTLMLHKTCSILDNLVKYAGVDKPSTFPVTLISEENYLIVIVDGKNWMFSV